MGQIYTGVFENVTVTALQDLFELIAPADAVLEILRWKISQEESETSEQLGFKTAMAAGSYTTGSGGTTPTPGKTMTGAAASGSTLKANNTTEAVVGTGTLVTIERYGENVLNGVEWIYLPEDRPVISPTDAFIIGLMVAPVSLEMSGTIVWRELGGA
jgi:3D (Asp-Asp-Asp) domain-containing protein